jgi:hypothetical protein
MHGAWAALTEVRRVLRPGGIATLSTKYRLSGPGPGLRGVLIFDEAQLRSVLEVDGSTWELVEPLDVTISEATLQTVVDSTKRRPTLWPGATGASTRIFSFGTHQE